MVDDNINFMILSQRLINNICEKYRQQEQGHSMSSGPRLGMTHLRF